MPNSAVRGTYVSGPIFSRVLALGWVVAAGFVSYGVATGPPASRHNSDSLIPVFVSLESWTPFYWGQDRFGMLTPLLALPVRDGLWNLIVQNALSIFLLLLGTATVCHVIRVRRPSGIAFALLAVLLPFGSENLGMLLLTTNQSYSPAMGLFGLAMGAFNGGGAVRVITGCVLMTIGAWTNAGAALYVVCLSAALCVPKRTRTVAGLMLLGALAGIAANRVLQAWDAGPLLDVTRLHSVSAAEIPSDFASFWLDFAQQAGRPFLGVLIALWFASILVATLRTANHPDRTLLCTIAVGSFIYALLMVTFFHGLGRHMSPFLLVGVAAPLIVLHRGLVFGRGADLVVALAALAVLVQTGITTPRTFQRELVASLGRGRAEVAYARGAKAVTGDYWQVWPIAFAANLIHEQKTGERVVLPIAMRAERLISARARQLTPATTVLVVPSGDFDYWRSRPELPPLSTTPAELGGVSIAHVAARQ